MASVTAANFGEGQHFHCFDMFHSQSVNLVSLSISLHGFVLYLLPIYYILTDGMRWVFNVYNNVFQALLLALNLFVNQIPVKALEVFTT